MSKKHILVTNDDGIYAPGIKALWEAMSELGHVTVVAPNREQSAVGHAITLSDPLRVDKVNRSNGFKGFSVDGTPSDCVKIATQALLEVEPNVIISGINLGSNTGTNIIYSGTVSAATEGTMLKIPSVAVSLNSFESRDFAGAKKAAKTVVSHVLEKGLPEKTLLNVNVPAISENELKGYKITQQGNVAFRDSFEKRVDPKGRVYYWMTGQMFDPDEEPNMDHNAIMDNFVSISPIHYRLTNHDFLDELKSWDLS
ncbi:MAG: 5'/3'-nucleotidase SurE [Candidatus Marinimicrobia bacterium]|jgi:5'-nucleotidase|nr:5'/3'-nucleotidase SurE [Candidatus Neomarinimicrobiota bacterium]|tara:strand:+ start:3108 stop:3872 length:765 start_codon:yes stop_codon:yes gene_type:complete